MHSTTTKFGDAVYYKKEYYTFGPTVFSRQELRILLNIDGEKTVSDIANILHTKTSAITPDFARLITLGLIQTDEEIISSDISDMFYEENSNISQGFIQTRPPLAV